MTIDFGQAHNGTAWHPEPDRRGTYGLLSSCLFTMALCVWTAVHLNLPEQNNPRMQSWRKVWWLLLGLFAPELVAWTAFEQNREARVLHRKMKEVLGEEIPRHLFRSWTSNFSTRSRKLKPAVDLEATNAEPTRARQRHKWTITHSHYAIMGGFAFDTDIAKCEFLPEGRKRAALTSSGVLRLATVTPHLLPDLSVNQIKDKSKANRLAKTIVALQATWFAAQCISRMAVGLTISLLELNTFAHAICALVAYFLWWNKPLDIEEPTLIEGSDMAIVGAGMCMKSSMGTNCVASGHFQGSRIVARLWHRHEGYVEVGRGSRVEFGLLESLVAKTPTSRPVYAEVDAGDEELGGGPYTYDQRTSTRLQSSQLTTSTKQTAASEGGYCLFMGQSIFGFGFRRGRQNHFNTLPFRPTSTGRLFAQNLHVPGTVQKRGFMSLQRPFLQLTSTDVLRLQLAQQCYQKYSGFIYRPNGKEYSKSYLNHPNQSHQIWLNEYIVARVRNWPLSYGGCIEFESDAIYILFTLLISGLAYGGLHLLAWNPPVTKTAEVLMWRISGITVALFGAIPVLGLYVMAAGLATCDYVVGTACWEWLIRESNCWPRLLFAVAESITDAATVVLAVGLSVVIYGGPLLYVWSRVYLLVECIASIPRLPDSVFETVSWSKYFPHLT